MTIQPTRQSTTSADDERLARLLCHRAAAVEPRLAPLPTIVQRGREARRHRQSVVLGAAAMATAAAGAGGTLALVSSGRDTTTALRTSADPASATSAPAPATSTAPAPPSSGSTPVPGPPLRVALELPGATATAAMDVVAADTPRAMPPGVRLSYESADRARILSVLTTGPDPTTVLPTGPPLSWIALRSTPVDLGSGITGDLKHRPAAGALFPSGIEVTFDLGEVRVLVSGVGLTESEVLAAARTVSVSAGGAAAAVGDVPADLEPKPPSSPFVPDSAALRTQVVYALADGTEAVVEAYTGGSALTDEALAEARSRPTADQYVMPVRGADAVVRRFAMGDTTTVSVNWTEASGHLVSVRLTPRPGAPVPDPTVVATGIRVVPEEEFRRIFAAAASATVVTLASP